MKKSLLIAGVVSLFLTGCRIYPDADFAVNYTTVQPGEAVVFTNLSDDAVSFEWDFGDGGFSTAVNPSHVYTSEGTYRVTLTAVSRDGKSDRAYINIDVIYTLLEITVAEWNSSEIIQFIVPDALVILYESYYDWIHDINAVVSGYTDYEGVITFAGLDSRSYYVYAEAADVAEPGDWYDNLDFPESDLYTDYLVPFALNTFLCWVHYFPPNKDMKLERRDKYPKNKIKSEDSSFIVVDVAK